jgi:S1-C subfamily serine protease
MRKVLAVPLLAGALAASACTGDSAPPPAAASSPPAQGPVTSSPALEAAGGDVLAGLPALVDTVEPSVVTILTDGGLGSGVVYDEGGIIVTNEHVVGDATEVEVALADGTRVAGRVLAADPGTDLAVVQAAREDLPPLTFQTRLPDTGEFVIAVGSPLGFQGTVTAGIVSGIGRSIPGTAPESRAQVDLIQTDAAISPGNSGGALINTAGEVVGINDAYLPPETGAVSIGFAIPADTVVSVVEDLREDGTVTRPFLGLTPAALTPQIQQQLGVDVDRGVVVLDVVAGGPAAEAGIRPGDVVTALDDERLDTVESLLGALRDVEPGQRVGLTVVRGGQEQVVTVTVGAVESGGR